MSAENFVNGGPYKHSLPLDVPLPALAEPAPSAHSPAGKEPEKDEKPRTCNSPQVSPTVIEYAVFMDYIDRFFLLLDKRSNCVCVPLVLVLHGNNFIYQQYTLPIY